MSGQTDIKKIKFVGEYVKRSSRPNYDSSVPSEREILELNPQRRKLILDARHWKELVAGTFNIKMDDKVYNDINTLIPLINEPMVTYPEKFRHIAEKRAGYLYYKAKAYANGKKVKCLFRTAKNRIAGLGELLSYLSIEATLGVKEGDKIDMVVYGSVKDEPKAIPSVHHYFKKANGELCSTENVMNGGHAFLIASGKSFNALDKKPLGQVYTMCLNNSVKATSGFFRPNAWTCVDGADKFLYTTWANPHILKMVPDSHIKKHLWNSDTNKPFGYKVCDMPNVLFYPRNSTFTAEQWLDEPTVNWGCGDHTCTCGYEAPKKNEHGKKIHAPEKCPKCGLNEWGGRSVLFAGIKLLYILGFRNIYLLGVDFEMKEGEQNYSFEQDRKPSAVSGNNSSYKKMNNRFKMLRNSFDKHGLRVYNCNKKSQLDAFEFIDYEEALKKAMWYVPDYKAYCEGKLESTANLYETKWYVCPKCSTDQRVSKEDVKKKAKCIGCGKHIKERYRKKYCKDNEQNMVAS